MVNDLPRCLQPILRLFYLNHKPIIHGFVPVLFLYGVSPSGVWQDIADFDLQPVMTFNSEVLAIQSVKKGEQIGYGSRYTAQRDMRIAVVACGYADGYPRHAPDGTPVIVKGT